MQARYQFQATPVRTLVAMLIALAALLGAVALGYSVGHANGASQAVVATEGSVKAFPFGPADRASAPTPAADQAVNESAFPYGPADRAGR